MSNDQTGFPSQKGGGDVDVSTPTKVKRRRRSERNAAMYDEDTVEFIQAIDAYRRKYDRSFPAWSEVLSVLKSLGYRKVEAPEGELPQRIATAVDQALPEADAQEPMEEGRNLGGEPDSK